MGEYMVEFTEIASGLAFPEGPIAMEDGSVLVVEIAAERLTRIAIDGRHQHIARLPGGPNGAAIGPDGACYVCNNGGSFHYTEVDGLLFPGPTPPTHRGGSIDRVDLATGKAEAIYTHCGDIRLCGPNDIVFDRYGGFWFTDHGATADHHRRRIVTGVFYAQSDGSSIIEVIFPLDAPNGIGLSPDGGTLYVAETFTGRLWAFEVAGPGRINPAPTLWPPHGGRLVAAPGGLTLFDSLGVDGDGHVNVATLLNGGITCAAPDGSSVEHIATGDPLTTNICFGGADLRTAYLTLSGTGRIVSMQWPRPGLKLNY
ncbi:MAG: SMP-30/gluconolactonase/LRE family protein [Acidiphilium sp.]